MTGTVVGVGVSFILVATQAVLRANFPGESYHQLRVTPLSLLPAYSV